MKFLRTLIPAVLLSLMALTAFAADTPAPALPRANDVATQHAILEALPEGVTADTATSDQIAQAAIDTAFGMDGDVEANVMQVTVALGELNRAGKFKNAPRIGDMNPPGRFYTKVMNLASSNLDVSSSTYYALTVQDMTRLSAAVRKGQNFLNGATSNPLTRK
jgi:hypothetical protein